MLEILNQAELEVSAHQDLIRGPLKVVLPVELGHQVLGSYINAFLKHYPHVTINLELSNREVDVISEGIDLYAQVGELQDSSLISRHLTKSQRVLAASPDYLQEYGKIHFFGMNLSYILPTFVDFHLNNVCYLFAEDIALAVKSPRKLPNSPLIH